MSVIEKAMPLSGDTFNKTLIYKPMRDVSCGTAGVVNVTTSDGTEKYSTNTISIDDDRILLISMDYDITSTKTYKLTNATVEWSGREEGAPTGVKYVASVKKTDRSKPIEISFLLKEYRHFHYIPIAFE